MTREMDIIPVTSNPLKFTRRWFLNRNYDTFKKFVYPKWAGKPLTYLEIGVFEGMSMVWMLQHILTHDNSRGVGIDPWFALISLLLARYITKSSWTGVWNPFDARLSVRFSMIARFLRKAFSILLS